MFCYRNKLFTCVRGKREGTQIIMMVMIGPDILVNDLLFLKDFIEVYRFFLDSSDENLRKRRKRPKQS